MDRLRRIAIAVAALAVASGAQTTDSSPPRAGDDKWRPLFNGRDLSGWETFLSKPDPAWEVPGLARDASGNYVADLGTNQDPLKVFTVATADGRPAIHISGQGFGVMTTLESFTDYHLRLQFKWGETRWGKKATAKRDSGLLYRCHGAQGAVDKNWPRSVELQIQETDTGDLYALGTQVSVRSRRVEGVPGPLFVYDPKGDPVAFEQKPPIGNRCVKGEDREKPRGEWNSVELISLGAESIHVVNGVVVMRLEKARGEDGSAAGPLTSGRVSLQTEGAELFYRDVEIRPITAIPAEFAKP